MRGTRLRSSASHTVEKAPWAKGRRSRKVGVDSKSSHDDADVGKEEKVDDVASELKRVFSLIKEIRKIKCNTTDLILKV